MAGCETICNCVGVDYLYIRMAMVKHTARSVEEIKKLTGAGTDCGACQPKIQMILNSVCGCRGTSLQEVVEAVKAGAKNAEAIGQQTGAGIECGRCKILIANITENGR